ncbi:MAG: ABC transporter substrate binding protein [Sideroxydans sp.]|jgi:ABC-type uncharacterized transport system substrate-binding protein
MFTRLRIAFLHLFFLCSVASAAEPLHITLVLSDDTPLYQSFADSLSQNLNAQAKIVVMQAEAFTAAEPKADLIVTVGIKAANQVAPQSNTPLLATLVTLDQHAKLSRQRPKGASLSAIFLNQPFDRQLALLRAALPDSARIGLLYSAETRSNADELKNKAAQQGVDLIARLSLSGESLHDDLEALLDRSDVLLAIPDSNIYNSNTLRNILLQSYRHDVPLVGYSQSLVRAGALCAVYSTPEQIAAQASAMALQFAKNKSLPAPQHPKLFSIEVNADVARSMGITLPSAELLRIKIDKMQGGMP